ncbi:hypothetical protein ABH37_10655 [Mycobacterium haemophilum]|uniref:Uncharacterized protein n=1 Tax=Mycobacterium haemophilum TaxID=29311 RepID=A0A0I9TQ88_9MYCO|nr:hypothetical protein ABH39_08105 [Mycobacterium haemophilum]KLO36300.1 hypothetical protein ABH38_12025 [Mycobacterium haemophilum]KLO42184.1 hypothetical protein ABH37_10655 [Mycobacterium haemophilum]KLO49987.1 hypothetical protein ABH36_08575 [Mycobacterium haemophilum]
MTAKVTVAAGCRSGQLPWLQHRSCPTPTRMRAHESPFSSAALTTSYKDSMRGAAVGPLERPRCGPELSANN